MNNNWAYLRFQSVSPQIPIFKLFCLSHLELFMSKDNYPNKFRHYWRLIYWVAKFKRDLRELQRLKVTNKVNRPEMVKVIQSNNGFGWSSIISGWSKRQMCIYYILTESLDTDMNKSFTRDVCAAWLDNKRFVEFAIDEDFKYFDALYISYFSFFYIVK